VQANPAGGDANARRDKPAGGGAYKDRSLLLLLLLLPLLLPPPLLRMLDMWLTSRQTRLLLQCQPLLPQLLGK
jgi:hypothetical protein